MPDRASMVKVFHLAWPVVLSNITTPLLGIVDTAVVGRLPGPEYIGAVAIGALVFSYVFWSFGFLRMGTTGFAAQAVGERDGKEVSAVLIRALLIAAVFGAAVILLQWPIWLISESLLGASQRVEGLAAEYYGIRIFSAPATLANYALLGWLIGLQKPRLALVLQIWLNGVNIVLDILFVLGFGWGVAGVAAATLIGEWSTVALGLVLAFRVIRAEGYAFPDQAGLFRLAAFKRLMSANLDIFLRSFALISVFAYITNAGARFGDLTLAANAVLMSMVHLIAYGLDGFAFAVEALVGTALGQRNLRELRQAVVASTVWALIVAMFYVLAFWLGGTLIIQLMTDQVDVQQAAARFLPWVAISPLLSVWCFQLDGIFIGATQTRDMRNAMLPVMVIAILAVEVLSREFGNHGLWAALLLFFVLRAGSLVVLYPRIERRATVS